MSSSSDPRRPTAVIKPIPTAPTQATDDYFSFFALMLGIVGLLMRQKWAAWGALYCCLVSFANMKRDADLKQMTTSFTFAAMTLAMVYLQPQTPSSS